jgi:hypothetical protein
MPQALTSRQCSHSLRRTSRNVPPQDSAGKQPERVFAPNELLFRQVPHTHVEEGEVSPAAIKGETKFSEDPKDCTSVVRSGFAESYHDCLHPNCADDKDLSQTHTIWQVPVAELPHGLMIQPPPAGPVRQWDIYPHHDPRPLCYAHSTICCCAQDQPGRPIEPPKTVRNQFRAWFAETLVLSTDENGA